MCFVKWLAVELICVWPMGGFTCGTRGLAGMATAQAKTASPVKSRARLVQESRRVAKEIIDAHANAQERPAKYKTDSEAYAAVSIAARAVGVKKTTPGSVLRKAYETALLVYEHSELRPVPALLEQTLVAIVAKTKRDMEKRCTPSVSAGEANRIYLEPIFTTLEEPNSFDKAWRTVHYGTR